MNDINATYGLHIWIDKEIVYAVIMLFVFLALAVVIQGAINLADTLHEWWWHKRRMREKDKQCAQ
jgi:hypothetical protein